MNGPDLGFGDLLVMTAFIIGEGERASNSKSEDQYRRTKEGFHQDTTGDKVYSGAVPMVKMSAAIAGEIFLASAFAAAADIGGHRQVLCPGTWKVPRVSRPRPV